MPLAETLPYGLRDIKFKAYTNSTTLAPALIELPNARTLSFEEAEEFQELRGDDQIVATRGTGGAISWDLEAGGISLEAYQTINGGTVTSTGITPAQLKTYKKAATDARPEFQIEGQAISESGGDFHVVLYRCKATGSLSGELADGAFWLTAASGSALPCRVTANVGLLYSFVQNETVAAIV